MAHVSATIPWEEGKEEDFKELREGLEKIRAGEKLPKDSSSESEDADEGQRDIDYQKYVASDSDSDDEEEEDPGESNPGLRLLWCAQYNHLSLAANMISSNPQLVFTKDSDLYTPLHRAAYSNHTEMLTLLLGKGHRRISLKHNEVLVILIILMYFYVEIVITLMYFFFTFQ